MRLQFVFCLAFFAQFVLVSPSTYDRRYTTSPLGTPPLTYNRRYTTSPPGTPPLTYDHRYTTSPPETPLPCVPPPFQIDVYNVTSTVSRRFACTRVYSEILNTASSSQEMCFSLQLPKEAFMSGLCLEVGGRKYSGVVREKEAARQTHEQNVRTGVTSGLVESRFVCSE